MNEAHVLVARAGGAEALVADLTCGEAAVQGHVVAERLTAAVDPVADVADVSPASGGCAGQEMSEPLTVRTDVRAYHRTGQVSEPLALQDNRRHSRSKDRT